MLRYTAILVVLYSTSVSSASFENNACKTLESYRIFFVSNECYYNPDVLSDPEAMARRHNYGFQSYAITTDDGYILNVFRISSNTVSATKYPIFLQHGLWKSSAVWVAVGNRSLAFKLADLGYDVWMGNMRGTTYANKHAKLTVYDPKYWEFNLDRVTKDISLQLNLVANKTGRLGNIVYYGHSMGGTVGYMYASSLKEEAHKLLQGLVTTAAVVYLDDVTILNLLKPFGIPFFEFLASINIKGLFYPENVLHPVLNSLCKVFPEICRFVINIVFGPTDQLSPIDLLLVYSYFPTGTSIFTMQQYLQIFQSSKFQKYDFGKKGNMERYGTPTPPLYDLSNIDMPVAIFYGRRDSLCKEENVQRLFEELGSTTKSMNKVPTNNSDDFDDLDFVFSKYIEEYFYNDLFNVFSQFA